MKEANSSQGQRIYINVLESLVAEEVAQQLQKVPSRIRRYIRVEEVVTYALNRLPAMYASSEKGWQYQRQLAKRDLSKKIQNAVHQGIMAVQVDPIRLAQPLQDTQHQESEAVLQALRSLFNLPELSWSAALQKVKELKNNPALLANEPSYQTTHRFKHWQPGTYSSQVAWSQPGRQPHNSRLEDEEETSPAQRSGWNSALYRL